jgi:hypothetical protein
VGVALVSRSRRRSLSLALRPGTPAAVVLPRPRPSTLAGVTRSLVAYAARQPRRACILYATPADGPEALAVVRAAAQVAAAHPHRLVAVRYPDGDAWPVVLWTRTGHLRPPTLAAPTPAPPALHGPGGVLLWAVTDGPPFWAGLVPTALPPVAAVARGWQAATDLAPAGPWQLVLNSTGAALVGMAAALPALAPVRRLRWGGTAVTVLVVGEQPRTPAASKLLATQMSWAGI